MEKTFGKQEAGRKKWKLFKRLNFNQNQFIDLNELFMRCVPSEMLNPNDKA